MRVRLFLLAMTTSVTLPAADFTLASGPEDSVEVGQRAHDSLGAWQKAWEDAMDQKAMALAARGDSRSLLMAVALARIPPFDATAPTWSRLGGWLDAARIAAPDDARVDWMALLLCHHEARDACSIDTAGRALKRRDPDNAAVPLALLRWEEDERASRALLHEAAMAQGYESPVPELAILIKEAIAQLEPPPMTPRLRSMMETWAWPVSDEVLRYNQSMRILTTYTWHLPAAAYAMCGLATEETPEERRDDCRRIMVMLAADDASLLVTLFGTMGAVRLPTGEADGAAWRERLRDRFWLMEQAAWGKNAGTGLPDDIAIIIEREPAVLRERLRSQGMSLSPPDGWLPADPRRRDLVTTGHAEAAEWMREPLP